jgi:hypothetical protein
VRARNLSGKVVKQCLEKTEVAKTILAASYNIRMIESTELPSSGGASSDTTVSSTPLLGKTALVTGASRGIGASVAVTLHLS